MFKATYQEMERLLRDRIPFRGSSVTAVKFGERYTVYSYDTVMYEEVNRECSYVDNDFYSSTTSRIQNLIKKVFIEV